MTLLRTGTESVPGTWRFIGFLIILKQEGKVNKLNHSKCVVPPSMSYGILFYYCNHKCQQLDVIVVISNTGTLLNNFVTVLRSYETFSSERRRYYATYKNS